MLVFIKFMVKISLAWFLVTPSSQEMESPANPGRFNLEAFLDRLTE